MPWVLPLTDNGRQLLSDICLVYYKIRTCEESGNGNTNQKGPQQAASKQKGAISVGPKYVSRFGLKLVRYSLKREAKQNSHPHPIRATKTSGVEQWKGCKKCAAKSNQCGKGKFPLTTKYVYQQPPLIFCFRQREKHRLSTLNKK